MLDKVHIYSIDRVVIFLLFLLFPLLSLIGFEGKFTLISLLFITVYFSKYSNKSLRLITWSYPLMLWLALTVYHWINATQKKVPEVDFLDLLHGIKIFTCIVLFTYWSRKYFDQTIKSLLICFQIYLILVFIINSTLNISSSDRLSGVVVATALGQTAAITGIYVAYFSLRNNLTVFKTAILYIIPLLIILLTQSRNSLAMISIGILGHSIAFSVQRKLNMFKVITTFVIFGILSFFIFDFVINNTAIGSRLSDTETAALTAEHNNLSTGTFFDTIVGDRLIYYVRGWEYFLDSPLSGIGMWNYQYLSQGNYPLHSEYMVHLSEGGIIGASIWLLFIISIFRGVIKSQQLPYIKIVAFFSLVEIMFCGIYARVFYYEFFYPVIGIAISLSSWGIPVGKKIIVKYV